MEDGGGVGGFGVFHVVGDDALEGESEADEGGEGGVLSDAGGDGARVCEGVGLSAGVEAGEAAAGAVAGEVDGFDEFEAGVVEGAGNALASEAWVDGDVDAVEGVAGGVVAGEGEAAGDLLPGGVGLPCLGGDEHAGGARDDLGGIGGGGGDELALGKEAEVGLDVAGLKEEFDGEGFGKAGALEGDDSGDVFGGRGADEDGDFWPDGVILQQLRGGWRA